MRSRSETRLSQSAMVVCCWRGSLSRVYGWGGENPASLSLGSEGHCCLCDALYEAMTSFPTSVPLMCKGTAAKMAAKKTPRVLLLNLLIKATWAALLHFQAWVAVGSVLLYWTLNIYVIFWTEIAAQQQLWTLACSVMLMAVMLTIPSSKQRLAWTVFGITTVSAYELI